MNINNGELLSSNNFTRWGLGEPNGNLQENCASLNPRGFWNDEPCYKTTCVFCDFGETPIYIMRGLCSLW